MRDERWDKVIGLIKEEHARSRPGAGEQLEHRTSGLVVFEHRNEFS